MNHSTKKRRRIAHSYDYAAGIKDKESGYVTLARAICAQAVRDYVYGESAQVRREAKEFILSPRFEFFSGGMDGQVVLSIVDRRIRDGLI